MTNNLKNEKGGKYPQKFYEKLKKASLTMTREEFSHLYRW